ncbi:unnamed protein product [Durusdinium trenchii]|uniref:N-acetyltransferase domain-containing protein n=1 Tax=Durusdinium trenchii TaxID=1381693 RepID=A0ABP0I8W6_9DINO
MLRPALPKDGPEIAKVYLATWYSHHDDLTRADRSNGFKNQTDLQCQEVLQQQAERSFPGDSFTNFLTTGQRCFIVVEADQDSAGCCLCAFISYGQSYTREGFGEVMQLFVHPEFQRKGLGSSLLRAAWRHMQSKEWSSLGCHVWCTKGNPANKVYEQVGWFPTGNQKSLYPTLSKEPVEVEEYMALDLSKRKDNLFWIWRLLMVRLSHCGSCCGQ